MWDEFLSSKEEKRLENFGFKWWKYATNSGEVADLTGVGFSAKSEVASYMERLVEERGEKDHLFSKNSYGDWQSAGDDVHVDVAAKPGEDGLYDLYSGGKKIGTYDPEVIYSVE
jgi:hypothetical protein